MLKLLVAAAAAVALPGAAAGSHVASEPVEGPLRQPSTPGQDSQECGFLLLPRKFTLSPQPPSTLERYGAWETTDSSTLLTWQQPLLRWSVDATYFFIGPQFFMKFLQEAEDTVTLRDCVNQLMYTLRVDLDTPGSYRIYNREDELVARSSFSDPNVDMFKNQLEFYDSFGQPIAIAHNPAIPGDPAAAAQQRARRGPARGFGGLSPWEVFFMGQAETNSSLIIAQNRWVVSAVVQDMQLREAPPPDLRVWFAALCALPAALAVFLLYEAMRTVYHIAYPSPRKSSEHSNPFMKDFQQYGALAARGQESQWAPAGPPGKGLGAVDDDLFRWGN